jgi:hypothetical protein
MPNEDPSSTASTPSVDELPALPEPTQEEGAAEVPAGLSSSRKPAIIAGAVALVILGILIALGVLLFNHPAAAARLRDIFIIFLGIQTTIIGLLMIAMLVALIYVALKLYDLTQFVEHELRPILERIDDTIRTVHSRTVFVSDSAVKPIIEVMSYVSAVKSIIRSFTHPRD